MPKQETYTLEEAKRRAAEVGREWTPELEADLRGRGKIRDELPPLPPMPELKPDKFAMPSTAAPESTRGNYGPTEVVDTFKPIGRTNRHTSQFANTESVLGGSVDVRGEDQGTPPAMLNPEGIAERFVYGWGDQGFFGRGNKAREGLPPTLPPAESKGAEFAEKMGAAGSLGAEFVLLSPLSAAAVPARLAAAAPTAANMARSSLLFGGHSALSGGDAGEIAQSAATGLVFGGLGGIPGMARVMKNPVGKVGTGYSSLVALNMLGGDSLEDAAFNAAAQLPGLYIGEHLAGPVAKGVMPKGGPRNAVIDIARAQASRIGTTPNVPATVASRPVSEAMAGARRVDLPRDAAIPLGTKDRVPLLEGSDPVVYAEPHRPVEPVPEPPPAESKWPFPRVEVDTRTHRKPHFPSQPELVEPGRRRYGVQNEANTAEAMDRLANTARAAARQGAAEVKASRSTTPSEAAAEYARTRTVTTDMLGGQQLWEWLSGGARKAGRAVEAGLERVENKRRAEAEAQADQLVEQWRNNPDNAWWLWSYEPPKTLSGPAVKPGNAREVEGVPFTRHLADYRNQTIDYRTMVERVTADPSYAQAPQEVKDLIESGKTRPISNAALEWRDRRRNIQDAGGGEFDNALTKNTIRVGELFEAVRDQMNVDMRAEMEAALGSIKRGSAEAEVLADVIRNTISGETPEMVAAKPEVQQLVIGAAEPMAVAQAAVRVRNLLDVQAEMRNLMNEAGGSKAWTPQEGYFPRTERRYSMFNNPLSGEGWRETGRAIEQRTRPNKGMTAAPKNPSVFSARELRSTGKLAESKIEKDVFKVLGEYTADTARKVGNTGALTSGETVVREFRDAATAAEKAGKSEKAKELRSTANGISAINQYSYGGKFSLPGIAGNSYRMASSNRLGTVALNSSLAMKRLFNISKYTLPIPFMVMRQWTSLGQLEAQSTSITPDMWIKALAMSGTKRIRQEYGESYIGRVKGEQRGKIRSQGMLDADSLNSGPIGGTRRVRDAASRVVDAPIQSMEAWTGQVAFAMAELIAKRAGLPPEKVANFKSDVAGATQSFYDRINRAPILNDPFLNLLFPAQSFSVEQLNNMYDIVVRGRAGMSGENLTPRQRAARAAAFLRTMMVVNIVTVYMNSYKRGDDGEMTWDVAEEDVQATLKNFLPYAQQVLPGSPSGGATYPAVVFEEIAKASEYIEDGKYKRAYTTLAKDLQYGGSTVRRYVEANRMVDEGIVDEDERLQAQLLGWWTTQSGMNQMQKYKRYDQGGGSPAPTSRSGRARRPRQSRPTRTRPRRRR